MGPNKGSPSQRTATFFMAVLFYRCGRRRGWRQRGHKCNFGTSQLPLSWITTGTEFRSIHTNRWSLAEQLNHAHVWLISVKMNKKKNHKIENWVKRMWVGEGEKYLFKCVNSWIWRLWTLNPLYGSWLQQPQGRYRTKTQTSQIIQIDESLPLFFPFSSLDKV